MEPVDAAGTSTVGSWRAPWRGLVAVALGLGVGELVAGVLDARGPVNVVGDRVIDGVPRPVKEWAIASFGTDDKAVLVGCMLVVIAVLAAVAGRLAGRRPQWTIALVAGALLLGGASAVTGRSPSWRDTVPMLVAAAVVLAVLVPRRGGVGGSDERRPAPESMTGSDRRRAIALGGGGLVAAGLATVVGRRMQTDPEVVRRRAATVLPPVGGTSDASDASIGSTEVPGRVEGEVPFIVPSSSFYRIDTALMVPRVDVRDWSLRIEGMVDRPITLTYDDLLARPQVEHMCTLLCVSNPVGGDLVGNARWQGVRLADVLREAGVHDDAEQLMSESVDGFTAGFPVAQALDGREALIAVGMNGEPLPFRHGYPARLVVPGLYGYVSAVKWLKTIRINRFADEEGYWIPRGWDAAPRLETGSRIDVPRKRATVTAGDVPVAGVAWAQHRGIESVEVRVDDGPWTVVTLDDQGSADTWRQWRTVVRLSRGRHSLAVRATDAEGAVQTGERRQPGPAGATGWHTVNVTAR